MVDVEFRIIASRREGLLIGLGQLIIANGFHLLRHRLGTTVDGVVLSMTVRGPENGLLQLEEHVGTHAMVLSFEAWPAETGPAAAASRVAVEPTPATPPAPAAAPRAAPQAGPAAQPAPVAPIDHDRVERLLPQLARSYPNFFLFARRARRPAWRGPGRRCSPHRGNPVPQRGRGHLRVRMPSLTTPSVHFAA
jgi:hypothetical protein